MNTLMYVQMATAASTYTGMAIILLLAFVVVSLILREALRHLEKLILSVIVLLFILAVVANGMSALMG